MCFPLDDASLYMMCINWTGNQVCVRACVHFRHFQDVHRTLSLPPFSLHRHGGVLGSCSIGEDRYVFVCDHACSLAYPLAYPLACPLVCLRKKNIRDI